MTHLRIVDRGIEESCMEALRYGPLPGDWLFPETKLNARH